MANVVDLMGLPPKHQQVYDFWFDQLDKANKCGGTLTGAIIAGVFPRSGLSKETLATIWKLSDRRKRRTLDRDDFYIALRLVAIAQSKHPVSYDSMLKFQDLPLPVFKGLPLPSGTVNESSVDRSDTDASKSIDEQWMIKKEEKIAYERLFSVADKDGDGLINGEEARTFFAKSGLHKMTLAKIWELSDTDKDHRLNNEEFVIAMHLITGCKRKLSLPSTLPDALAPDAVKNLSSDPANQGADQDQRNDTDEDNDTGFLKPKVKLDIDLNGLDLATLKMMAENAQEQTRTLARQLETATSLVESLETREKELKENVDLKTKGMKFEHERVSEIMQAKDDSKKQLSMQADIISHRALIVKDIQSGHAELIETIESRKKDLKTVKQEVDIRQLQLLQLRANLNSLEELKASQLSMLDLHTEKLKDILMEKNEISEQLASARAELQNLKHESNLLKQAVALQEQARDEQNQQYEETLAIVQVFIRRLLTKFARACQWIKRRHASLFGVHIYPRYFLLEICEIMIVTIISCTREITICIN